ncbi:MAG: two-component regulator propeller domain-containing protein, partial [Calditrichaceae bacterium]
GNKVLAINQQPTQMQYVGTENGGVSRLYYGVDGITGASTIWKQWTSFPDSTGIIQPGLLSDTVTAIMVSKNGDRWYGTQHGVSSHTGDFLKNPYSWTSYTTDNGLIDNNVQTLAEDSSGAIWIGTMGGASKLTPEDIQLTNFTMDSGLVSNDIRDIEVAEDGTIWFATAGGLSKLTITPSAIHNMNPQIAESFKVHPAYPNPFNMNTTMEFELFSASRVNITIFNINGQVISKLLDSRLMPGSYKVNWNGENESGSYIASGVYFARISASNRTSLLKLVLVK